MGVQKMTASFVIIVRFCRKSMKRIWRRAWRNQKKSVPLQANRKHCWQNAMIAGKRIRLLAKRKTMQAIA